MQKKFPGCRLLGGGVFCCLRDEASRYWKAVLCKWSIKMHVFLLILLSARTGDLFSRLFLRISYLSHCKTLVLYSPTHLAAK